MQGAMLDKKSLGALWHDDGGLRGWRALAGVAHADDETLTVFWRGGQ